MASPGSPDPHRDVLRRALVLADAALDRARDAPDELPELALRLCGHVGLVAHAARLARPEDAPACGTPLTAALAVGPLASALDAGMDLTLTLAVASGHLRPRRLITAEMERQLRDLPVLCHEPVEWALETLAQRAALAAGQALAHRTGRRLEPRETTRLLCGELLAPLAAHIARDGRPAVAPV